MYSSSASSPAAADSPPLRGAGRYEAVLGTRPELRNRPRQPCSSITVAVHRRRTGSPARSCASNATSVSTSARVARIAARDSALPARVPPTPPTSTMSAPPVSASRVTAAAMSARQPVRAARYAAADATCRSRRCPAEAVPRGHAAGAGRDRVRLVDHQQRAVLRRQRRAGRRGTAAPAARCRCWSAPARPGSRRRRRGRVRARRRRGRSTRDPRGDGRIDGGRRRCPAGSPPSRPGRRR